MYIGKRSYVFALALWLLLLLCFVGCNKTDEKVNSDLPKSEKGFPTQDISRALSGIWYHSPVEAMQEPMEDKFSWGLSTYGYWNALRIDLLGREQFVGFGSATWDSIVTEVDTNDSSLIYLHLGQLNYPGKAEVKIKFEDEGVMAFTIIDANTGETRLINGTFYKVLDPSKLDKAP